MTHHSKHRLLKQTASALALSPLVLLVLVGAGLGQSRLGSAANGKAIADRWCSACHLAVEGQSRVNVDAPTFKSIAQRLPDETDVLAGFIANPHPPMPNMGVSRQDIRDVLAYIATLK